MDIWYSKIIEGLLYNEVHFSIKDLRVIIIYMVPF